ncbi:hypothetical protein B484DRAFT_100419 [Ochromonadaceae sp. CCMP2298]|nr:hypothetical protein B484DRAFT_166891 [Ochromonadaceae sp. CCMP2298]KAJ1424136.1 hypothetical protein B484DRAFT_100419 [Ochromonadaceae sp. CCMP2298]
MRLFSASCLLLLLAGLLPTRSFLRPAAVRLSPQHQHSLPPSSPSSALNPFGHGSRDGSRLEMASFNTFVKVKSNYEAKCSLKHDEGCSLASYMQLPVDQYVCIKMPLNATLERMGAFPLCVYVCVYVYVCMHVYVCIYVYMYMCVCVYVYIYMYVFMYVCMYVCMYM